MNIYSGIIIIGDMAIKMNGLNDPIISKISAFILSFVVVIGCGFLERTLSIKFGDESTVRYHQIKQNTAANPFANHPHSSIC